MSLHSHAHFSVPEETQRVARAAFPKVTLYLRIGEQLCLYLIAISRLKVS
jgi:hypothetical protein